MDGRPGLRDAPVAVEKSDATHRLALQGMCASVIDGGENRLGKSTRVILGGWTMNTVIGLFWYCGFDSAYAVGILLGFLIIGGLVGVS